MPLIPPPSARAPRGFACLSKDERTAIARKGGASVPSAKRAFATVPGLAISAGTKGGKASHGGGRGKRRPF